MTVSAVGSDDGADPCVAFARHSQRWTTRTIEGSKRRAPRSPLNFERSHALVIAKQIQGLYSQLNDPFID